MTFAPKSPLSLRSNCPFIASGLLCAALSSLSALALSSCGSSPRTAAVDAVNVRLVAENTTWRAEYLTGQQEVPTGREVHVPIGADVRLVLTRRSCCHARSSTAAISPRRSCRRSFGSARPAPAGTRSGVTSCAAGRTQTRRAGGSLSRTRNHFKGGFGTIDGDISCERRREFTSSWSGRRRSRDRGDRGRRGFVLSMVPQRGPLARPIRTSGVGDGAGVRARE